MFPFKRKQEVTDQEPAALKTGEKTSFTGLAYRDYNSKVDPIKQEITELETAISDVLNTIAKAKKEGKSDTDLVEVIRKLRQKLEDKQKELSGVMLKNKVDYELQSLATELDRLEVYNTGVALYNQLGVKINQVMQVMNEIERCFGNEYYTPPSFGVIKSVMMVSIIPNMNIELSRLHKLDRKELEQRFWMRMEQLEKEKADSDSVKGKYRDMLAR